jgi:flagellar hook-length control protein FliK
MSISVATAVVASSAPSSVATPAALAAGAGTDAFQALLETFSSAATAAGDDSAPAAGRASADRTPLPGAMPAGAPETAKGGARTSADAPLQTDGRSAPTADASDQTAAVSNVLVLQMLPLPLPAPLPAADMAVLADGAATGRWSGPSIAAPADIADRSTSASDRPAVDAARLAASVDTTVAAGLPDGDAIAQAQGPGLQAAPEQTNPDARFLAASASQTAAYDAIPAGQVGSVGAGGGVRLAAARVEGAGSERSNLASTSAPSAGSKAPALRPVDANARADRSMDGSASIPPAIAAAESGRPGPSRTGIDMQFEARTTGGPATGKSGSPTPAEPVTPDSIDLSVQAAVTPRHQTPVTALPAAATAAEIPPGGAVDRRSAAGLRLAAALARGARAEGPTRIAAQTMSVDPDLQSVSIPGRVDAQADRLGDRPRTEPSTFGAAVSAAGQTPVRMGAAESGDVRSEIAPFADSGADIKASGLAALPAPAVSLLGIGAASSHAVAGTVAPTSQPTLDSAAEADLPRQIVHAMRLQWRDGIGDARIRLLPEYLGELNVAIRVEHGSVTASLEAATPAVRHWIESHEPMLRQSLAEHGLQLDRLIVLDEPQPTTPNPNRERRREKGEQPEQQPQSRRRPPADDTTFEVIV